MGRGCIQVRQLRRGTGLFVLLLWLFSPSSVPATCLLIPGDVNNTGYSDVLDIQCVLCHALGAPLVDTCMKNGPDGLDLDCTGIVDVADVGLAISYALQQALQAVVDADGNNCPDTCGPVVDIEPQTFCDVQVPVGNIVLGCDDFEDGILGEYIESLPGTDVEEFDGKVHAQSLISPLVGFSVVTGTDDVSSVELGSFGFSPVFPGAHVGFRLWSGSDAGEKAVLAKWVFMQGNGSFDVAGHAGVGGESKTFLKKFGNGVLDEVLSGTVRVEMDQIEEQSIFWVEIFNNAKSTYLGPFPCPGCTPYTNILELEIKTNLSSLSLESVVLYDNPFYFDSDGDGISNSEDNCVEESNYIQNDIDEDGIGDACDLDIDEDGLGNDVDICPLTDGSLLDADQDGCVDLLQELPSYIATVPLDSALVDQLVDFANTALSDYEALGPGPEPFGPGPEPFAPDLEALEPVILTLLSAHQILVNNAFSSVEPGQVFARSQFIEHLMSQFVPELDEDFDGVPDLYFDNCILTFNPSQVDRDLDGMGDACDSASPLAPLLIYPKQGAKVWGNVSVELGESLWSDDITDIEFNYSMSSDFEGNLLQLLSMWSGGVGSDILGWTTFNLPYVFGDLHGFSVLITDVNGNQGFQSVEVYVDQKHDTFFLIGPSPPIGLDEKDAIHFDASMIVDVEGEQLTYLWEIDGESFGPWPFSIYNGVPIGGLDFPPYTLYSFIASLKIMDPDGVAGSFSQRVNVMWDDLGSITVLFPGDAETGAPYCGCESMEVRALEGLESLDYPRGPLSLGPSTPAGVTLDFSSATNLPLTMNFEVDATLLPGSETMFCEHMQAVRSTAKLGERVVVKKDMLGNECPFGGVEMCNDGFTGFIGNATLEKETDALQIFDGHIRWCDEAGTRILPNLVLDHGFRFDADYYASVGGDAGKCECTWQVGIEVSLNGEVLQNEIKNLKCAPQTILF